MREVEKTESAEVEWIKIEKALRKKQTNSFKENQKEKQTKTGLIKSV